MADKHPPANLQDVLCWPMPSPPPPPPGWKPEFMDLNWNVVASRLTPVLGQKAAVDVGQYIRAYSARPYNVDVRVREKFVAEHGSPDERNQHLYDAVIAENRSREGEQTAAHQRLLANNYASAALPATPPEPKSDRDQATSRFNPEAFAQADANVLDEQGRTPAIESPALPAAVPRLPAPHVADASDEQVKLYEEYHQLKNREGFVHDYAMPPDVRARLEALERLLGLDRHAGASSHPPEATPAVPPAVAPSLPAPPESEPVPAAAPAALPPEAIPVATPGGPSPLPPARVEHAGPAPEASVALPALPEASPTPSPATTPAPQSAAASDPTPAQPQGSRSPFLQLLGDLAWGGFNDRNINRSFERYWKNKDKAEEWARRFGPAPLAEVSPFANLPEAHTLAVEGAAPEPEPEEKVWDARRKEWVSPEMKAHGQYGLQGEQLPTWATPAELPDATIAPAHKSYGLTPDASDGGALPEQADVIGMLPENSAYDVSNEDYPSPAFEQAIPLASDSGDPSPSGPPHAPASAMEQPYEFAPESLPEGRPPDAAKPKGPLWTPGATPPGLPVDFHAGDPPPGLPLGFQHEDSPPHAPLQGFLDAFGKPDLPPAPTLEPRSRKSKREEPDGVGDAQTAPPVAPLPVPEDSPSPEPANASPTEPPPATSEGGPGALPEVVLPGPQPPAPSPVEEQPHAPAETSSGADVPLILPEPKLEKDLAGDQTSVVAPELATLAPPEGGPPVEPVEEVEQAPAAAAKPRRVRRKKETLDVLPEVFAEAVAETILPLAKEVHEATADQSPQTTGAVGGGENLPPGEQPDAGQEGVLDAAHQSLFKQYGLNHLASFAEKASPESVPSHVPHYGGEDAGPGHVIPWGQNNEWPRPDPLHSTEASGRQDDAGMEESTQDGIAAIEKNTEEIKALREEISRLADAIAQSALGQEAAEQPHGRPDHIQGHASRTASNPDASIALATGEFHGSLGRE